MVLNDRAQFGVAAKLRREGAALGEIYTFLSGLYFRGKMAYAQAFAASPPGIPPAFVITPGRGLVPPDAVVTIEDLNEIASVRIDLNDPRYREPLERHARILDQATHGACEFVLLGSVATAKYIDPLLEIFRERLLFPAEFVGRGDMSRGGLMLRCARIGFELAYTPVCGARLHGPRPPKLPKVPWKRSS